MSRLIVILLIFLGIVAINMYVRIKAFGFYKQLVQNRIQFKWSDIFSNSKWEQHVLSRYPNHIDLLQEFRKHILWTGFVFVAVILFVLMVLVIR